MTAPKPMDTLAVEYDQWFDSPEGKELFEIELACVRDVLGTKSGRWLEVGVGTGRFAAVLGIQEGIDPSNEALTIARRRGVEARQGVVDPPIARQSNSVASGIVPGAGFVCLHFFSPAAIADDTSTSDDRAV